MNKTSVKTPNVDSSTFTVGTWRDRFNILREELTDKSLLEALVETDESYNVVKGGRYNDYRNVLTGTASLLATKHVCDTLEAYLKKGKRRRISARHKIASV